MADMSQSFDPDDSSVEAAEAREPRSRKKRLRLPLLLAAPVVLVIGALAFGMRVAR